MESWKRNLYCLWATEFLAALGMSLVLPFLPFFIRELGVSDPGEVKRWSGFVFAAPFLVATFTGPLWGWLGDRYGRRAMLIRALVGYGGTSFLMAFANTVEQLLILRLIQGGVSGFIAATLAIAATTTPREKMGYAMGVLQTSLTTGAVIGPFVGGLLADQIGYRHIFFITAGFGFAATILVILLVQENERPPQEMKPSSFFSNFSLVFTSPVLIIIFAVGFIVQTSVMSIQPVLSLFVEMLWPEADHLATVAGGIFAITGFASLISAPYWGKRGDRMGYKKILAITLVGTGITFVPQAFVSHAYQLLLLRFAYGLFVGGILPALYTLTSLNVSAERRGGILGITRSGLLLGNVVGPVSGGFLAASIGIRPLFIFMSALLFIVYFWVRRIIQEPRH
ncbi:MAG: MFS transporter [Thermodesulfobacteriota bacterium]|nr:MFS transporter [Thermodesulfobacteriota bacterium]